MSFVITESSTATCANFGTVTLKAGQSKLTVGGVKVLIDGDMTGAAISKCSLQTDPNTGIVQCLTVQSASGGVAGKLTVQGKGVLLSEINGQTSGSISGVAQTWSVQDAGQSKLKAV
jgi:hypothetical protein